METALKEDIQKFIQGFQLRDSFLDSTFLITGGSGLIGSTLIKCLMALSPSIKIFAPVRNKKKAIDIIGEYKSVRIIETDLSKFNYNDFGEVDYIVHGAAPTSSKYFVEFPVETIDSILSITKQLLDYSKNISLKAFVFLSSLEVYGQHQNTRLLCENEQGTVSPLDVRSSYPLAKQMAENLCVAYCHEYDVPIRIARLTQTTGPGVSKDDNRVIVQFVRCAVNNQDIELHTTGESSRPYCYTIDAIEAILYILAKGKNGEAYNVANESSFISAKSLAYLVREELNPNINIKFDLRNDMGYAPITYLNLSTKAIQELGWIPKYNLSEILSNLFQDLKDHEH